MPAMAVMMRCSYRFCASLAALFSCVSEGRLLVRRRNHEIGNARHDFPLETRAVEDAVMSYALLNVVDTAMSGDRGAQAVGGFGLSKSRNVVVLAFYRHQRDAPDLARINPLAAMGHLALGQSVLDEHGVHGLQIIFRGKIHHRQIFIIEVAVLVDEIAVTLH